MTLRSRTAEAVTSLIGSAPVASLARRRWADRLRVVDYHGIEDADAFAAQVAFLAGEYSPVGEAQVREALLGGAPLPPHAVWVTFDDGDPSVVQHGVEVLHRHGVPATFYVCPGLVEAQEPPWWELVYAAARGGVGADVHGRALIGAPLVQALKLVPDPERRAVVDQLRPTGLEHLETDRWVLTRSALDRWVDAGNEVGNHTWDHPCLHRCDEAAQTEQITRADAWLRSYRPGVPVSFAYPNGDHTDHAESVLVSLGYDVALLSDHRLVDPVASPQRTSRLRLDASAPITRARAVLSGLHSAGYELALRRGLTGPARAGR